MSIETRRPKLAGLGKILLGFLGILVTIMFMALAPGPWRLLVFALALAALGYLAALYGVDSRDGKDW